MFKADENSMLTGLKNMRCFCGWSSIMPLLLWGMLGAGVKSTTGRIDFDVNADSQLEASFNTEALVLNQGLHLGIQTVSSNVHLGANTMVLADTRTGPITLTLPRASACRGRLYQVKLANGRSGLSIVGTDLIDQTQLLRLAYSATGIHRSPSVSLLSTGSAWSLLQSTGDLQHGPKIWLDANDVNADGVVDVVSEIAAVHNTNFRLSTWSDLMGSGNYFNNTNGSKRAIYHQNVQNGLNAVSFLSGEGSGDTQKFLDYSNAGVLKNLTGLSVLMVLRVDGDSTIFNIRDSANSKDRVNITYTASSSRLKAEGVRQDSDSPQFVSSTLNSGDYKTVCVDFDYTNASCSIYEGAGASASNINTSFQSAGTTDNSDSSRIRMGVWGNINHKVGELLVFDRSLSSSERQGIMSYLNTKWGL